MSFIDTIKTQARKNKKTIVLPETSDSRTIEAAVKILNEDFAELILIGEQEQILSTYQDNAQVLKKATFLHSSDTALLDELIELLVKLRAHKGDRKSVV